MAADITDLRIGDVASEILEIERSVPLDGEFDIALGNTFTDPRMRALFARVERTYPVRHYRLRDVTLDASTMLLLCGRGRIVETRYFVPDDAYEAMLVKPLHPADQDSADHYVIGCNRAWHNYYHWLIQAVPAIDASLRHATHRKITLVLPPELRPWQDETLALLGYQDIPRLTLHVSGHYLLPSAEFSDFLSDKMPGVVVRTAMATYRRMSRTVPWSQEAAEEIYVARTDAQNRIAENEAELIELLQRQGVRIVVPGTLSVAEQIAAFRAARLVIGPHGSGMSNIVFCRGGSFVYELLPRHYPNIVFNRVAQSAALNYAADMFEGVGEGDEHERRWRIDLDLVAARLKDIRATIAATPRVKSAIDFLRRTHAARPDETTAVPAQKPVVDAQPPSVGLFRHSAAAFRRFFSSR